MDPAVHERHMRQAIEIANGNPDAPFGTVIADGETGKVLAEGLNDAEKNPILHGEIDAILNLAGPSPMQTGRGSSSTPPLSPAPCAPGRSCGAAYPTSSSAPR